MAVKDEANNQDTTNSEFKDNGTDANAQLGISKSAFDLQTSQDLNQQKIQDELYAAIKRGDRVRVEELIDRGADVNTPDKNGTTAMMNAVENNDSGMSREFVQQKSNGNIAFDPTADQNLTGGLSSPAAPPTDPSTGQVNPNAPGQDDPSGANVASAVSQGITADEARAAGNYALAAQLDAQEDLAQEAREANEGEAVDTGWDDDRTYAASAYGADDDNYYDGYDGYYDDDPYDPYDPWDDDYDPYSADGYGNDDYGDDYGYGADGYGADDYGAADPADSSGLESFTFTDPSLAGFSNTLNFSDPSLTGSSGGFNFSDPSSPSSSFFNFSSATSPSTDPLSSPSNTGSTSPSSNFFNFSSPLSTGGAGQTVWDTSFFDPAAAVNAATNVASTLSAASPTIAPTNPYYKPTSGSASASMGM